MIKAELQWFNIGLVKDLYPRLKPEDHYKHPVPDLDNFGFYMFYVDKEGEKAKYVGQAPSKKRLPLQSRVRWEIVKDGKGCTESAFFQKCEKYKVDRFNLLLKVAHIKKLQRDGIDVTEVDDKMMNAIERALIFKLTQLGHLLMNETSKKSYRIGPIDMINNGDHKPLPPKIVL